MSAVDHVNEVDETIKDLKANDGFEALMLMNKEGIVIRWENMEYKEAVHYGTNVKSLFDKAGMFVGSLLEPGENELQTLRMNASDFQHNHRHELIVSQVMGYLMLVIQKEPMEHDEEEGEEGEGKEGEEAAK